MISHLYIITLLPHLLQDALEIISHLHSITLPPQLLEDVPVTVPHLYIILPHIYFRMHVSESRIFPVVALHLPTSCLDPHKDNMCKISRLQHQWQSTDVCRLR